MSCWRLLLLCLALWLTSLTVTAQGHVVKWPKGKDLWVRCPSDKNPTVTRRIFCKNDCEEEDVLVQTSGWRQTNGRYWISHRNRGSPPLDIIFVTISNLSLSDSGRYRCFWDRPGQSEYREFMLEVTDGAEARSEEVFLFTEGEDFIFRFYFINPGQKKTLCRNACSEEDVLLTTTRNEAQSGRYRIQYWFNSKVTVTITDLNTADSGLYQCRLDEDSRKIWISVAAAPPSGVRATEPPSETTTEQEPTTHPGDSSKTQTQTQTQTQAQTQTQTQTQTQAQTRTQTQSQTLVLVLVPVCGLIIIIIIVTAVVLIYCRRRSDLGTAAGGAPQSDYLNVRPNATAPPEAIHEELQLDSMEPTYDQLDQV